jgi:hypothetical protein
MKCQRSSIGLPRGDAILSDILSLANRSDANDSIIQLSSIFISQLGCPLIKAAPDDRPEIDRAKLGFDRSKPLS